MLNKQQLITKLKVNMDKKYTKNKSAKNYTDQEVANFMNTLFTEVSSELGKGEDVRIYGFGKWEIRRRKARTKIDISTKKKIYVASKNGLHFTPSQKLLNDVKNSTPKNDDNK